VRNKSQKYILLDQLIILGLILSGVYL